MRTEDFDYHLPAELIAQQPVEPRDASRLLALSRSDGACHHYRFFDLPSLLRPGDRLVFNDTRVLPARLMVRKANGLRVELFFLEPAAQGLWRALVKPGRRVPAGTLLLVEEAPEVQLFVAGVEPDGVRLVQVELPGQLSIEAVMERYGHTPLPHYIEREDSPDDRERYQTVYAAVPGAVAAPTAGLHFTTQLIEQLRRTGIATSSITLHVGVGTFRPVKVENPADHPMHEERYEVSVEAAREISATRAAGGRIIAVGTTVVRVLEHCFATTGTITPHAGRTRIMILPPWNFGLVDGLVTNFHLPRSTLLMLVSAFAGREQVLRAYGTAVAEQYRFYSYGDAMFIA